MDAGSYLVSAASLVLIPATPRAAAPAEAPEAAESVGAAELAAGLTDTPAVTVAPGGGSAAAPPAASTPWQLLRQSRVLQVLLVVVLSADFALAGTTEVALPALAHARFGADGYGAVLTCVAVAAMAGALSVGKFGDRFRPVTLVAGSLIVGAAGIAAAPFLGGLPGVAAGLAVFGVTPASTTSCRSR